MPDPQPPRIFVSHTGADTRWCGRFVQYLEEAGADVWWDIEDLRVGRLDQVINQELPSRPYFISVLSPDAVKSEWVKAEISTALGLQFKHPDERIFLPVVARKCEIPPLIETFKRVTGRNNLAPKEAADEVIRALGLTPVRSVRAHRGQPRTVEDAILRSKSFIAQGRPQDALEMADVALKLDRSSAAAWSSKGRALNDLHQLDAAEEAFARAIACDPNEASGWAGRGQIRGEKGESEAALSDLDHALRLKPDYLSPLFNRSTVLLKLNRLDEALAAADQGVKLEPKYGPGLYARGRALQALNRYDEALAAYETALAAPDNPEAPATTPEDWRVTVLLRKAESLSALRSPFTALVAYEQALQRDETNCPAWKGKGDTLWMLGRYQEALDAYDHALAAATTADEQAYAWHGKGAALIGLGKPADAKSAFTQALSLKPDWSNALHGLGDAMRDQGELAQSADAYRRALAQSTLTSANTAEALNSLAGIAFTQGEIGGALALFDRAIAADRSNARFWLNKINVLTACHREEDALKVQQQLAQELLGHAVTNLLGMPNRRGD